MYAICMDKQKLGDTGWTWREKQKRRRYNVNIFELADKQERYRFNIYGRQTGDICLIFTYVLADKQERSLFNIYVLADKQERYMFNIYGSRHTGDTVYV